MPRRFSQPAALLSTGPRQARGYGRVPVNATVRVHDGPPCVNGPVPLSMMVLFANVPLNVEVGRGIGCPSRVSVSVDWPLRWPSAVTVPVKATLDCTANPEMVCVDDPVPWKALPVWVKVRATA